MLKNFYNDSIDSKISGAGTVLKRDYSPKARINIRPETGEARFELPLWENRNDNTGGSTISEARSSIWNRNGVQMALLLLRGTPSGDTFVLSVCEQDRNSEKNPVKVRELVLEWQKDYRAGARLSVIYYFSARAERDLWIDIGA